MRLEQLGWNGFFEAAWNECDRGSSKPGRIVSQNRDLWHVAGEFGEANAVPAGKLRWAAEEGGDWGAVGDWVTLDGNPETGMLVGSVLRRRTEIARKAAGRVVEQQVLAANVDIVFLVMALNGDFNPRRLERYLAQVWDTGARPVIVLNKQDLCEDVGQRTAEIDKSALGLPVFAISAATGQGIDALKDSLRGGKTIVLLGSSGVGKSSLANRLMGSETQAVRPIRLGDDRGRHTTSSRQLFVLPSGALLIDTPGLRELQLWDAAQGLESAFGDIEELAAHCRFTNCSHRSEPYCAVLRAIERAELHEGRLENYRKLRREEEFLRRRIDPAARQQAKQSIRAMSRAIRVKYKRRADTGKE